MHAANGAKLKLLRLYLCHHSRLQLRQPWRLAGNGQVTGFTVRFTFILILVSDSVSSHSPAVDSRCSRASEMPCLPKLQVSNQKGRKRVQQPEPQQAAKVAVNKNKGTGVVDERGWARTERG